MRHDLRTYGLIPLMIILLWGGVFCAGDSAGGDQSAALLLGGSMVADAGAGAAPGDGSTAAAVWSGTRQLGVAGRTTNAEAITTDGAGNVIMTGFTNGDLDGNIRTGLLDMYLTKYSANGNKEFTRMLGVASKPTYGYGIAADGNQNIYVVGFTVGGLDGQTLVGSWDMYMTKYDSAGVKQFTVQFGTPGRTTTARDIAVDGDGNIYITGVTRGSLGGQTLTGTQDLFLVKYDVNGNRLFTRLLGSAGKLTFAQGVAVDGGGNVFIAGYTSGGLDGNAMTGLMDMFLVKYDAAGNRLFTRQLGATGEIIWTYDVAVDGGGNAYVTGYTSANLDGNTVTGTADLFLTKYNNSGTKLFTRMIGVAGATIQGQSMAVDGFNNVFITGYADGGIDGNTLNGVSDVYMAKFDSDGAKQFTRQLGVAGEQTAGRSIAPDGEGNIFVGGQTSGGLDGNSVMGAQDFFITKYNSEGVKQ